MGPGQHEINLAIQIFWTWPIGMPLQARRQGDSLAAWLCPDLYGQVG